MPATSLYRDQPSSVQGLKVSQWSYATYRFDVAGSYAVEVIDSGPSDSEPKLVVKKGAPPTRDDYDQEDWFASFYDFSDIHVVRGTANQGDVLYIGVVNDDVAGAREACSRSRPECSPTTASAVFASELCPAPPRVNKGHITGYYSTIAGGRRSPRTDSYDWTATRGQWRTPPAHRRLKLRGPSTRD